MAALVRKVQTASNTLNALSQHLKMLLEMSYPMVDGHLVTLMVGRSHSQSRLTALISYPNAFSSKRSSFLLKLELDSLALSLRDMPRRHFLSSRYLISCSLKRLHFSQSSLVLIR